MFKDNKYSIWYSQLIENARARPYNGYVERHHIIPRCMGGSDEADNLVSLSAHGHFVAHLLLTKMVPQEYMEKIVYAAWQQSRPSSKRNPSKPTVRINGRIYAYLREQLAQAMSGKKRAPFSDEARANMRVGAKTRRKVQPTPEATTNRRAAGLRSRGRPTGRKGVSLNLSEERLEELSDHFSKINKGVPKTRVSCIHCRAELTVNTLNLAHGERCGLNPNKLPKIVRESETCEHCGIMATRSNIVKWHGANCRSLLQKSNKIMVDN